MPPHAPSGYSGSSSSKPLLPPETATSSSSSHHAARGGNGGGASETISHGVPRPLGNPAAQKRKDIYKGGGRRRQRIGGKRLPLVGLGLFDVLLLVATVVGVYQGHLADFWRDHYTEYSFDHALLDCLVVVALRGLLLLFLPLFLPPSLPPSSRAFLLLFVLSTLIFLIVKAACYDWEYHREDEGEEGAEEGFYATPAASVAVLLILFVMGLLELPVIFWERGSEGAREGGEEEATGYVRLDIEAGEDEKKKKNTPNSPPSTAPAAPAGGGGGGSDMDKPPPLTFRQLLSILKPYFWPSTRAPSWLLNRVRCVSTWVFVTGSKVASVYSPIFLSLATSALSSPSGPDYHKASGYAAAYCALTFGSRFLKECQNLVYLDVKKVAYAEICASTFRHLLDLSLHWHLKKKIGVVIRAMDRGTDAADTVVTYLFLYLLPALGECLAVCIIFLVHFRQWELSLLLFSSLLLYGVVTVKVTLWRRRFREASNKKDNEIHERATDTLVCFEMVKAFTNEAYERRRFQEAVQAYQKYSVTSSASLSLLNILQQAIVQSCCVGTLILTAHRVYLGEMDVGDFVAVNVYTTNAFQPLNFLGSVYTAVIKALVDMQNLNQLLLEAPDVVDQPNARALPPPSSVSYASQGLSLEFRDVSFHYPEQPPASGLKHVSFTVPAGTTTALVGHTGSGKTTCSRLLFRYYDTLSGDVLLNGQSVKGLTQTSVRALIGVVPQDTCLFNDTLLHNIRYGKLEATLEEVEAAAEAAQLGPFIASLPLGYDTIVGERGLKLSGGEKQRVAIARCLLKNPPLVLLDEATSALDSRTENLILKAQAAATRNRTTLVIAHRLSTIRHADQIVVLENGQIKEKGTHEELLQKEGEDAAYRKMWEMQRKGGNRQGWGEGGREEEEGEEEEEWQEREGETEGGMGRGGVGQQQQQEGGRGGGEFINNLGGL